MGAYFVLAVLAIVIGFFLGRYGRDKTPTVPPSAVLLACLLPFLNYCGFEIVDTGYRGVETRFGKVMGEPLPEGLHFYNPFTSDIHEMDVRERKVEEDTSCFTKDTQTVVVKYSATYYPDKAFIHKMYEQFGDDWDSKIVKQVIIGSLKDTVGSYIADDLVQNREKARVTATQTVTENLASRGVTVTRVDLVNLDFDDTYESAVEQKVVAIQDAAKAKNKTVEVQEKAKQTIESAKAEAESMRIRANALTQNKSLVEYEAVQKWNGVLPTMVLGDKSVPFINMTNSR